MKCPWCQAVLDEDSWFCDQCGKELWICPKCKELRKGKVCTQDGTSLVTVAAFGTPATSFTTSSPTPSTTSSQSAPPISAGSPTGGVQPSPTPVAQHSGDVDELILINKNLNLTLQIQPGDIVGRTEGRFAGVLSQYKLISRKHCVFQFIKGQGWTVTDLGSTNGVKCNDVPLQPFKPHLLADGSFLLVGNIEFYVQLGSKRGPDATERM